MPAKCAYFGRCGGCQHQDVEYAQQLQTKARFLSTLFKQDVPIRAHPNEYAYRNRMDFACTPGALGLKAYKDYSTIVDIQRCEIQNEALNSILSTVREWVAQHAIACSRPGHFEGFLRFIMIRGDEHAQQLTLTTTNTDHEDLVDQLAESLNIASVVWTTENNTTEASVGSVTHKVYGDNAITLRLADKSFLIDARTFFQTSPEMASQAIQTMQEYVNAETVTDLYCGVGVLGQCVAQSVIGVDNNASNIEQARENARTNAVDAEYVCTDAGAYLMSHSPELVIVDPPRTGLQMGVHTLMAAQPQRIIYLSCNPKTQARDLVTLKRTYDIIHIEGFDFFPHTDHIECLVVLEKRSLKKEL